jgi:hypothetical protein
MSVTIFFRKYRTEFGQKFDRCPSVSQRQPLGDDIKILPQEGILGKATPFLLETG